MLRASRTDAGAGEREAAASNRCWKRDSLLWRTNCLGSGTDGGAAALAAVARGVGGSSASSRLLTVSLMNSPVCLTFRMPSSIRAPASSGDWNAMRRKSSAICPRND